MSYDARMYGRCAAALIRLGYWDAAKPPLGEMIRVKIADDERFARRLVEATCPWYGFPPKF